MPDTLESRRTKRGAQGYGGRNEAKASAEYHLLDYTEPEPKRRPSPPEEEGEASETT